jgi:uroporphyrinogen-III decarboxylase
MELYIEIEKMNQLLNQAIKEVGRRGKEYAEAYKNYRMLLSKELLLLRDSGVPATLAYDIARGKKEIAEAKENEIIKESLYKSVLEAINVYKIQINILREQINREYNNA